MTDQALHPEARRLVESLELVPHPEGGWYRETWRSSRVVTLAGGRESREAGTAIYYLLAAGAVSRWHRLRFSEVWHLYAGGPMHLHLLDPDCGHTLLTMDRSRPGAGNLQAVVPGGTWFGARLEDPAGYALAGCTLAPGFDFADFELADTRDLKSRFPDLVQEIDLLG